jgi:hypothetical protein
VPPGIADTFGGHSPGDAGGAWGVPAAVSPEKVQDVLRGESLHRNRSLTESIRQELAHPPPASGARPSRQPADVVQMLGEAFQFVVDRRRHSDTPCGDRPICTQHVQQMLQGRLNHEHGPLTPARTAALGQVRGEKSTHVRFVETSKLEVLLG